MTRDEDTALFTNLRAALVSEETERVVQLDMGDASESEIGARLFFRCLGNSAYVDCFAPRDMSLADATEWLITGMNREREAFIADPPAFEFGMKVRESR
jgi:hypothetical protein